MRNTAELHNINSRIRDSLSNMPDMPHGISEGELGAAIQSLQEVLASSDKDLNRVRAKYAVAGAIISVLAVLGAFLFYEDAPGATEALVSYGSDLWTLLVMSLGELFPYFQGAFPITVSSPVAKLVNAAGQVGAVGANTTLNYAQLQQQWEGALAFRYAQKTRKELGVTFFKFSALILLALLSQMMFAIPSFAGGATWWIISLNLISTLVGVVLMYSGTESAYTEGKEFVKSKLEAHKQKQYKEEIQAFLNGELLLNQFSPGALAMFRKNFMQLLTDAWVRVISAGPEEHVENLSKFERVMKFFREFCGSQDQAHREIVIDRIRAILGGKNQAFFLEEAGLSDFQGTHTSARLGRILNIASQLPSVEVTGSWKRSVAITLTTAVSIAGQTGFFGVSLGKLGIMWGWGSAPFYFGLVPLNMLSLISARKFVDMVQGMWNGKKEMSQLALGSKRFKTTIISFLFIAAISYAGSINSQGEVVAWVNSHFARDSWEGMFFSVIGETIYYGSGILSGFLFNGMLAIKAVVLLVASLYCSLFPKSQGATLMEGERVFKEIMAKINGYSNENFLNLFHDENHPQATEQLSNECKEWIEKNLTDLLPARRVGEIAGGPGLYDTRENYVQLSDLMDRAASPDIQDEGSGSGSDEEKQQNPFYLYRAISDNDRLNNELLRAPALNQNRNNERSCCNNIFNFFAGRGQADRVPLVNEEMNVVFN